MQINIVVFILVIRQMMGTRHVQNKTQIEKVKAGVKATAVILPLLGITWLFGLLSFSASTVAFKYIFAIANSLQGLMIFIFHCLLNKQVRGQKYLEYRTNCAMPVPPVQQVTWYLCITWYTANESHKPKQKLRATLLSVTFY